MWMRCSSALGNRRMRIKVRNWMRAYTKPTSNVCDGNVTQIDDTAPNTTKGIYIIIIIDIERSPSLSLFCECTIFKLYICLVDYTSTFFIYCSFAIEWILSIVAFSLLAFIQLKAITLGLGAVWGWQWTRLFFLGVRRLKKWTVEMSRNRHSIRARPTSRLWNWDGQWIGFHVCADNEKAII